MNINMQELGLGDISNICDVSRDVLQGMYKMPLSRTSTTNRHVMLLFTFLCVHATGRQDPIQSERRDAYRANLSREKTGDKFDLSHHTFAVHRRARSRGMVTRQIRSS